MSESNNQAAPAAINKDWHESRLPLATTIKGSDGKNKRSVLGYEDVLIPSLDCCGEGYPEPKEIKLDQNGVIEFVYESEQDSILQKGLTAAILQPVRGTVQWSKDEDGNPVYNGLSSPCATNWTTFLESSGGSMFMAVKAEWINKFKAYAAALTVPENAKAMLIRLIESGKAIEQQPDGVREKVAAHVVTFIDTLGTDDADAISQYSNKMAEYLQAKTPEADAFEF